MMIVRTMNFPRNDLYHDGPQIRAAALELAIREPQTATPTTSSITPSPSPSDSLNSSDSPNQRHGIGKTILEYIFLGVALVLVVTIIFRRLRGLKPANQSYWAFFVSLGDRSRRGPANFSLPRTPLSPSNAGRSPQPPYTDPSLAGLPAAYQGYSTRRTRAQDVDAGGRRIGNAVDSDHDGALEDKDILPAYDVYGGPPKYVEAGLTSRQTGVESVAHPPVDESANRASERDTNIPPESARAGGDDGQDQTSLTSPRSPVTSQPTNTPHDATSTDTQRAS